MAENNTARKGNITLTTQYGAAVVPFVIVGGALIAFAYLNSKWRRRNEKPRVLKRSVSLAAIHGGKLALQRLIEYHEARADANKLDICTSELNNLCEQERPDFLELQRVVAKMEMSGNEAKAEGILQDEKKKAIEKKKNLHAYEIEMLIVELLIYKGDFKNAEKCKCLSEGSISDVRRPLYKAIIMAALDRAKFEVEGGKYWEEFKTVREEFEYPSNLDDSMQVRKLATNFDEFKRVLFRFTDDIKAHPKKKKI